MARDLGPPRLVRLASPISSRRPTPLPDGRSKCACHLRPWMASLPAPVGAGVALLIDYGLPRAPVSPGDSGTLVATSVIARMTILSSTSGCRTSPPGSISRASPSRRQRGSRSARLLRVRRRFSLAPASSRADYRHAAGRRGHRRRSVLPVKRGVSCCPGDGGDFQGRRARSRLRSPLAGFGRGARPVAGFRIRFPTLVDDFGQFVKHSCSPVQLRFC